MEKISYRKGLAKIGIGSDTAVRYNQFHSKPQSLRQAIRAMDAPSSQQWQQVSDLFLDEDWTDEVQGVAWNGSHWIFSTNANQIKPGHEDKALYVFKGGQHLGDKDWVTRIKYANIPHLIASEVLPGLEIEVTESDSHYGQLTYHDGFLYVSHFWKNGPKAGQANVIQFKSSGAELVFQDWIKLDRPKSPTDGTEDMAEFQGINPWNGMFYTCFGGPGPVFEFFQHDPENGNFTGETLKLAVPVSWVQGACFSPNGHLYIASNAKLPGNENFQTIWYYSALNGHLFGVIPVLAEESSEEDSADSLSQELEGICYANVIVAGGQQAQIHAVLLENRAPALDNIFFKSFRADKQEVV